MEPGGAAGRRAGFVVQHRRKLHHQHQLAELRRRKHAVLSRADAGADPSELFVGGDRHCARRRVDPRLCAAFDAYRRQFLGRCHALHALRAHSDLRAVRAVPDLAGHSADARPLCRRDDAGRRQADYRGRPGRFADRHQDARHQWRRIFQRQRRASIREPDRVFELRPDAVDLRHRRRADQRVWPHGRRPAPGLGGIRRHGGAVRRRRGRLLCRGSARQRRAQRARPHRRQHGGQGNPLRHCRRPRCSRSSPPPPRAVRSTPCTIPSPRSAA